MLFFSTHWEKKHHVVGKKEVPWPQKNGKCFTLPETNIAPENRPPRGNSFSNHPFSGAMLVSGRVLVHNFRRPIYLNGGLNSPYSHQSSSYSQMTYTGVFTQSPKWFHETRTSGGEPGSLGYWVKFCFFSLKYKSIWPRELGDGFTYLVFSSLFGGFFFGQTRKTGWWFQISFIYTPDPCWEMIQFDFRICFRWVGVFQPPTSRSWSQSSEVSMSFLPRKGGLLRTAPGQRVAKTPHVPYTQRRSWGRFGPRCELRKSQKLKTEVIKLPILGESNSAHVWYWWGISLTIFVWVGNE